MLSAIPVIGWLIVAFFTTSAAVPAWLLWNYLVPIYVPQMPALYQNLPFWHVVGIFWLVGILKWIFLPTFSVRNECQGGK